MSGFVTCPSCQRGLQLPAEQVGQVVQCPICTTRFIAQASPPAGPAQERPADDAGIQKGANPALPSRPEVKEPPRWPDTEPGGGPRREGGFAGFPPDDEWERLQGPTGERAAWARVRTGLTIVLISLCCTIGLSVLGGLCVGGATAAAVGAAGQGGAPDVGTVVVMIVVLAIAGLALQVLTLVGYAHCAAAPPMYGARGLGMAALILGVANLVLGLLSLGMQLLGGGMMAPRRGPLDLGGAGVSGVVDLLSGVMGLAVIFVFLYFLRAVALNWNEVSLARSITGLVILIGVLIALFVAVFAAMGATLMAAMERGGFGQGGRDPNLGPVAGALGLFCLLAAGALGALVWYIVVLVMTRNAIRIHS
ncbi:MAG: zinc-ribbon domain-containing protein [Gemmataceae bacterium]|nr:zinc-ribbon domain-containing protein [Gemmataceae bacterium]